jgi:hypothetical protein
MAVRESVILTKDPLELVNLVHSTDSSVQATISQLESCCTSSAKPRS